MYCRDTDLSNQQEQLRERLAFLPLSGRHGVPSVQKLHLSLPPAQKEDHPGLHRNSVLVSWKPSGHFTGVVTSGYPTVELCPVAHRLVCGRPELEVCGRPCAPCASCQAIGWNGKRIMHLWQILWSPDQGQCSLHVQKGCFSSNSQSVGLLLLWWNWCTPLLERHVRGPHCKSPARDPMAIGC